MVDRRAQWLGLALLVLLALVAALHWRLGIPPVADMEGYLYLPQHRLLMITKWALPLAVIAGLSLVGALWLEPRRRKTALLVVFIGALAAQHYAVQLDGPGWRTLILRFESGHGDFLYAAWARRGLIDETLTRFEELQQARELGLYAPSKPPGIMLVYAGIDWLGRNPYFHWIAGPVVQQAQQSPILGPVLGPSAAAASVLFPIGSALVVFPLYLLGLAVTGERSLAISSAAIGGSIPSFVIFSGHTDGGLFPLVACLIAALAAWGARHLKLRYALVASLIGTFGLWVSFSLLPAMAYATVAAMAVLFREPFEEHRWKWLGKAALVSVMGAAVVLIALWAVGWLGDPLLRFSRAMAYHRQWKVGMLGGQYAAVGLAEMAVYIGIPTVVLYLTALTTRPLMKRERVYIVGISALIVLQALSSGAVETARTWLFLVPFIAIGATIGLRTLFATSWHRIGAATLILANLVLIPIIRSSQGW